MTWLANGHILSLHGFLQLLLTDPMVRVSQATPVTVPILIGAFTEVKPELVGHIGTSTSISIFVVS